MRSSDIGGLVLLVVLFALVSTILWFLVRFWGECQTDTARARERSSWPTATVEARLVEVELRSRRVGRLPSIIGHYAYEFAGATHTTEIFESASGTDEERRAAARELMETGKVIDLEVQYDPKNPSVVSDDIVTSVPSCQWWIGSFMAFFALMMLLILRGFFRLIAR
ncbi:MAG: DUF3592 domain-containing protein [Gemmatimonadales bacterium]|jgi:hypothetical protein